MPTVIRRESAHVRPSLAQRRAVAVRAVRAGRAGLVGLGAITAARRPEVVRASLAQRRAAAVRAGIGTGPTSRNTR